VTSAASRYLHEFERQYPEIKPYFDMKLEGVGTRKERIIQKLF
jgi:hypothetical protein